MFYLLLEPTVGSESLNLQAFFFFSVFRRQEGVMVPGVPCVDPGNWERDRANVLVSRSKILFHGVENENEMAICHLFYA